jgi:hypothetical protein
MQLCKGGDEGTFVHSSQPLPELEQSFRTWLSYGADRGQALRRVLGPLGCFYATCPSWLLDGRII